MISEKADSNKKKAIQSRSALCYEYAINKMTLWLRKREDRHMRITNCRINRMIDPVGFDLGTPRASWVVQDTDGKRQRSAHIEVSADSDFENILWSSGEAAISSLATEIDMALESYKRYWWRVSVIADNGDAAVSDANYFETAKLDDPWEAE